ncbi:MAG TPA: class E sortase [Gaiellaceae bacterium]|nr:class E sortase [Gaiellaceae bacterium]
MKTSVPLIASLLAGTLVFTFVVLGERSGERVAQTVSHTGAVREVEPPNVEATVVSAPTPKEPAATVRKERAGVNGPARISIPRLRLNVEIGSDLAEGPAWWPVTGRPGGGDTIAVAGHRTTYTRPFYWLERLRPGDTVTIRWQGRVHAYRVSGRRILSAQNLHIADARGHEILLLSACTPRGSARQRIVVYAWPESSENIADDAPASPPQKS